MATQSGNKKQPFFSVVIPTKNRPEMLRQAIQSVLLQDFRDCEIIVSDNFNDESTKKVVEEFLSDSRVVYVRTDRDLNMPDHWEFATSKATGKYVLIVTDRALLYQGALKKISKAIGEFSSRGIEVFTWPHTAFNSQTGLMRPILKHPEEVVFQKSATLRRKYAREQKLDWRFPVLPNACYANALGSRIREKHGRMFFPIAPDGTSCFLLISHADSIANIDEPLMVMQTAGNSNGMIVMKTGVDDYMRRLHITNWYRHVPIKMPFIQSLNFDDFLVVRAMVGKEPLFADVGWVNYFLKCYEEYVYFGREGFIKDRKAEFLKEWERALALADRDVQDAVQKGMFRIRVIFTIKAILANSRWVSFLRRIQSMVSRGSSMVRYASALEAAGFKRK